MGISNEPDGDGTDARTGSDGGATATGTAGESPQPPRPPKLPVFTISPRLLWLPIMGCIVFSGLLAAFLRYAGLVIVFEPIPEDEYGFGASLVNALIFIIIGAASAFILIKLVRKRGINILEKIMMLAFLILGTFIIYLYGMYGLYMVDQVYPLDISVSYLWPAAAFGLSLLLVYIYATPRWGTRARNVAVMEFGILIGSYLPLVIGTWTSLLILMGFALYDIYSVRKGPIKEMMEHIQEGLTTEGTADDKFDVDDIDLDIGIGDLAFYSMLTSITLISAEWGGPALVAITENALAYFFPFILTIIGVLLGAFISYEFVKKAKIIPGLPMSIFIGIGLLSLAMLIGPLIF